MYVIIECLGSKQNLMFANWYYDTNYQRCRRYNHHIENFVYFQFLKDCKRLCPVIRQRKNEKIGKYYFVI